MLTFGEFYAWKFPKFQNLELQKGSNYSFGGLNMTKIDLT